MNKKEKYTDEEKLEVYFKSAEQTADDRIEWFKKSITWAKIDDIDHADLIQMEIEEIKAKLQKNKESLEKAQIGNTEMSFDPNLFEYLRKGLEPENSEWVFNPDRRYDRFLAVVDYKYLKKLKSFLKFIQAGVNINGPLLKRMVNRANELHEEDWEYYKPARGNPVISTYVKKQLSEEFEKGVTTIHEWFNDYCEKKDLKTIQIKTEVIASLKSE